MPLFALVLTGKPEETQQLLDTLSANGVIMLFDAVTFHFMEGNAVETHCLNLLFEKEGPIKSICEREVPRVQFGICVCG